MLAKDKVCSALDVGFCEELSAGLSEDCVLETEEFAGVVTLVLLDIVSAYVERRGKAKGSLRTAAEALRARACPPLP